MVELNAVGSETRELTDALKLRVDWSKSFGWSVQVPGMDWWKQHGPSLVPEGEAFQLLPQARDLGVALRFRHLQLLGSMRLRLTDSPP